MYLDQLQAQGICEAQIQSACVNQAQGISPTFGHRRAVHCISTNCSSRLSSLCSSRLSSLVLDCSLDCGRPEPRFHHSSILSALEDSKDSDASGPPASAGPLGPADSSPPACPAPSECAAPPACASPCPAPSVSGAEPSPSDSTCEGPVCGLQTFAVSDRIIPSGTLQIHVSVGHQLVHVSVGHQ